MKIAVIAFSHEGLARAEKIRDFFLREKHEVDGYVSLNYAENTLFEGFPSVFELAGEIFDKMDAMVYVGACGIAVRSIAPHIKSKYTDPAVVVLDEQGLFSISVLSGHEGGANELSRTVASIFGAIPIVTTASEVRKSVKNLVVGIGCRRGTSLSQITRAFVSCELSPARVKKLCSIDIKADEKGLLEFAQLHSIPLEFFSAESLMNVEGEFSKSDFVQSVTGVDNVCERSAVLGGGNGRLIQKKTAIDGVTLAIYEHIAEEE